MFGNVLLAQIEHIARVEHISNYNYDHLLRLIPSLGDSQKDTICKVVRIWYKGSKITLVIIEPEEEVRGTATANHNILLGTRI